MAARSALDASLNLLILVRVVRNALLMKGRYARQWVGAEKGRLQADKCCTTQVRC